MTCSNTNKHQRLASLAFNESQKSDLLFRHGCVISRGRQVIARGHNNYRTHSSDGFINNTCSCHAEVDALRNMYNNMVRRKVGLRQTAKVV
tara:strand:- start:1294 stop:1566 length:273 start_codon:yes stop_codon:yes gene_type:complete